MRRRLLALLASLLLGLAVLAPAYAYADTNTPDPGDSNVPEPPGPPGFEPDGFGRGPDPQGFERGEFEGGRGFAFRI